MMIDTTVLYILVLVYLTLTLRDTTDAKVVSP